MVMLRCPCVTLYLQCLSCCAVCMPTSYNMSFHRYAVASRDSCSTVFTQICDHNFFLIHHLKNEGSCYSHTQNSTYCALVSSWKWSLSWGVIVFWYIQYILQHCSKPSTLMPSGTEVLTCQDVKMKGSNEIWNGFRTHHRIKTVILMVIICDLPVQWRQLLLQKVWLSLQSYSLY
jgi:hypothetical protein